MTYHKKLIEVSLPLEAINNASAREKTIIHGHPSTLHLWWSRKPLSTSRAILFASLVDDPSEHPELFPSITEQEQERQRLFQIIEELVQWKNSNNIKLLKKASNEITKWSNEDSLRLLDPFAGGGSIPLEAQRLGLIPYAGDLNPIAVLINKAQIEIPVNVKDIKPINPESQKTLLSKEWHDTQGITEDIRYYGRWMFEEAKKKIGHLYPQVIAPEEYGFSHMAAVAWLWVRAVKCPNPACGAKMPLASKWWLSKRKNHEVWVEPVINRENMSIQFKVCSGTVTADIKKRNDLGTCATNAKGGKIKATFRCICCNSSIVKGDYIDAEADKGALDSYPIAVVANSKQGKIYLPINVDQQTAIDTEVGDFFKKHYVPSGTPLRMKRNSLYSMGKRSQ